MIDSSQLKNYTTESDSTTIYDRLENYRTKSDNITFYPINDCNEELNDLVISADNHSIDLSQSMANLNLDNMAVQSYSNNITTGYSDTITLTGAAANHTLLTASPNYCLAPLSTSQIYTLTNIQSQASFNWGLNELDWQQRFPDWARVQDMCNKYPGLKIAFDNFKTFYEMVKDDYDNPTPKK